MSLVIKTRREWRFSCAALLTIALFCGTAAAEPADDIISKGNARTKAAADSQKRIDNLSDQTDKIVSRYHTQRKAVDGIKLYNDKMRRTLAAQESAMADLERSIEEAALIERQIVPLMMRMIAGLDAFIDSDIPFKLQVRKDRVERIRGYLTNANISAAERFRLVLQAYSIESNYGTTLDVYKDTLDTPEGEMGVNVLTVGRAGLYYQTLDGKNSGYWDKKGRQWTELDNKFNEGIEFAIRVVQGKEAKENLLELPLAAPEAR